MRRWFGTLPDFCIRLNANWAEAVEDLDFCATAKHELCHCDQAYNKWGDRWFRKDGSRVWTLVEHDVEIFLDEVRDFGPVGRGVSELAEILKQPPRFGSQSINVACGNCLSRAA